MDLGSLQVCLLAPCFLNPVAHTLHDDQQKCCPTFRKGRACMASGDLVQPCRQWA